LSEPWVNLILTSSIHELDFARARQARIDHYIVKRSDPDKLLASLTLVFRDWSLRLAA